MALNLLLILIAESCMNRNFFMSFLISGTIFFLAFVGLYIMQQKKIEQALAFVEYQINTVLTNNMQVKPDMPQSTELSSIVQSTSSAVLWRPIQEKVKDTVVQVYAQIAAIDMLQPYKTPTQGVATGSGFFIDSQKGYIVTNAHVVMQAKSVWIQIPCLGKLIVDVSIVGISPDRDLALLQVTQEGKELIKSVISEIPVLPLGDSDLVYRADEVLALGYPLGQMALKSTTGVVSGRERNFIQISAAINPGNSGGPLINIKGEVVGINSAGVFEAQNVGYAIPINDFKLIHQDLETHTLLRRPYLGIFFNNGSQELAAYLGNPLPGGCYINGVLPGSPAQKADIQPGDMLYEINGYPVDLYAEMQLPESEDKVSVVDYAARLSLEQEINFVVYRKGEKLLLKTTFDFSPLPAVRKVFPGFEAIDYEIFGGMVIMPLSLNHVQLLAGDATGLAEFIETGRQLEPQLVVTHIFPNSQTHRVRAINIGSLVKQVNGVSVKTLDELRAALKSGLDKKYATFTFKDTVLRTDKDFLLVLDYKKVLSNEAKFASDYRYPLSQTMQEMMAEFATRNK